jgi:hypothetical protein
MSDVNSAPADISVGDKVFRMSPLRIGDQMDFERWLQMRGIRLAKEAGCSPKEIAEIATLSRSIGFQSLEAFESLKTREGQMQLFWLGIRHNHPGVTVAELARLITERQITEAVAIYNLINYGTDTPEKESAPSGKVSASAA